jgi:ABC-type Zn uptake system ZnuABC Zn-binding protein ZnuA
VPVITLSQNVGDVPESKDYISMVEYNVNTLAKALAGRS